MCKYLLGIDIGTSAAKLMLYGTDGVFIAQTSGDFVVIRKDAGWAEQDPNVWWDVVCGAIRRLLTETKVAPRDIIGVGVDGQSWSAIPIDAEGNVLYNTPIWMDTRAKDICEELKSSIGEDAIFQICGNPLEPTYTTPKILWYKKHLPEVYKKTKKILQSNSFIAYRLTGALSHDLSQGYGLHFFDMRTCALNIEMCERMGIDPELIPPLFASHEVVGAVTEDAAVRTGLAVGTPVVAGGLDAACSTLGAGVIRAGQTQEQGGQAGGMSICIDEYHADPRLILSPHVVPGTWLLQGGTVGGGGILNWFEKEFGAQERMDAAAQGGSVFALMDEEAGQISPGAEGVVFLPYMSGERSPIWDDKAKGVFYGLDYTKTRAHFIRASLEGVAYSLMHNLDAASEAGVEVDVLHAVGGAAKSALWCGIKADITGKEIMMMQADAAASIGAIILAGVGAGIYRDFEEAASVFVKSGRRIRPNPDNRGVYEKGYKTYRKLYEQLKDLTSGEQS
ncbi:xylulokinase [Clostridia bacterium]|nr:xylulokinase [Clostridia bacterium]